ncbi:MAG TPA: LysE family translocator [Actinomycetes bacterium]|nr:LysE family translocator [Actinomycetes bacterium]
MGFLGISALVIVTPGQDTALTIRNTLLGHRRCGVVTALGVVTGQAAWALATGVGIAALLVASEPAFVALKLAGAAYLVVLGARALSGALGAGRPGRAAIGEGSARRLTPLAAYRQGVISNLGNPKMAVFFMSLLPQFTSSGDTSAFVLVLGLVFCLLTLSWLTGYAVVVAKAGDVLRQPRIRRVLDGLTGAVLLGLGLRLASEQR